ncbi:hypothetical protein N7489_010740, partial [Penicillium chrysogenum]|uniref:uncharacterized protein n=1 Tax=Penicillium chrysogenum TaxID=5076 RepID=UPI0023986C5A
SRASKVNGTIYVVARTATTPVGVYDSKSIASVERMIRHIEVIHRAPRSGLFYVKHGVHLTEDSEALYKPMLPFAPPRTTVVVLRVGNKSNKREIQMEVIEVE